MSDKTCGTCCTISSIASSSYVVIRGAKLPLIDGVRTDAMGKHECPLCGGDLVPMGWFRAGDLRELLHKCSTCGLAVFR